MKLDHLALGVNDLASGTKTLSEMFGVEPFGGGEHELFATHNKLWRIETPTYPIYLELIAVNPDTTPKRPRWFGLRERFANDDISLLGYIASTNDIQTAVSKPPFDILSPIDVARGQLSWKFGITSDGSLPEDGALPYLIEWQGGFHPLDGVAAQGLELIKLSGSAISQLEGEWPIPVFADRSKFSIKIKTVDGRSVEFSRSPL